MKNKKFSIIVPVYNTEKYLKRCIDSILNQTYSDFEVIIVNDGSSDSSEKIIKTYNDKKIIYISQENSGVSVARNVAINIASGDYLLFVDSDDYIEDTLLGILNNKIVDEDIIRYQLRKVGNQNIDYPEEEFDNISGKEAFKKICDFHFVEIAACYAFKKEYFNKNKFAFSVGKYHEDYGLIPLTIIKANKVSSINYIGYNYVTNENSITSFTNYEKELKKANDVLWHYKNLINKSSDKYYKSFLANEVLIKSNCLNSLDRKKYMKEIKKLKVVNNLLDDTIKRKIKKYMLKVNLNFIKVLK